MSRNCLSAAEALVKSSDEWLAERVAHDPDLIRDVAASCLWAWSASDKDRRQAFIALKAPEGVCRKDIASMFGVSTQQASLDLRAFQAAHPGWLHFDTKRRRFVGRGPLPGEAP